MQEEGLAPHGAQQGAPAMGATALTGAWPPVFNKRVDREGLASSVLAEVFQQTADIHRDGEFDPPGIRHADVVRMQLVMQQLLNQFLIQPKADKIGCGVLQPGLLIKSEVKQRRLLRKDCR